MKKLTRKLYYYQLIVNRKRWEKKLSRSKKINNIKKEYILSRGFRLVEFPGTIDVFLKKNRSALIKSLGRLRKYAKGGFDVVFDFSKVQLINAQGMILLYSEIARLVESFQFSKRCREPRGERESQVLKHIGLYKIINHKNSLVINHKEVSCWHKFSGNTTDSTNVGKFLDRLVDESSLHTEAQKSLYRGISEAITNVLQHAYILPRNDGLNIKEETKWCIFFREINDNLEIVCCDLGAGIPRTLSITHENHIFDIFGKNRVPSDSEVIEEATKINTTRTEKDYRGKGLPQIIESASDVVIFSNKGVLKKDCGKLVTDNYRDSILGTVIAWKSPLLQNTKESY